jgi:hypothetical protein
LVYLPIDYKAARPGSRKKKNCYRYTRKERGRIYIYSNQQIGNRIPSRFRERAHSADDDDSTQSAGKEKKKKSSSSSYISEGHAESKKNIFFLLLSPLRLMSEREWHRGWSNFYLGKGCAKFLADHLSARCSFHAEHNSLYIISTAQMSRFWKSV